MREGRRLELGSLVKRFYIVLLFEEKFGHKALAKFYACAVGMPRNSQYQFMEQITGLAKIEVLTKTHSQQPPAPSEVSLPSTLCTPASSCAESHTSRVA